MLKWVVLTVVVILVALLATLLAAAYILANLFSRYLEWIEQQYQSPFNRRMYR